MGASYDGKVISRSQLNQWEEEQEIVSDDSNDSDSIDQPLRIIPTIESEEEEEDDDEDEFDTIFEPKTEFISSHTDFKDDSKSKHPLSRLSENDKDELKIMNNRKDNKSETKPQSFQIRKAKAVAAQTRMYDKIATLRIHLQKVCT